MKCRVPAVRTYSKFSRFLQKNCKIRTSVTRPCSSLKIKMLSTSEFGHFHCVSWWHFQASKDQQTQLVTSWSYLCVLLLCSSFSIGYAHPQRLPLTLHSYWSCSFSFLSIVMPKKAGSDPEILSNCWPIRLLVRLSKVLGTVVAMQITAHLQRNNLPARS